MYVCVCVCVCKCVCVQPSRCQVSLSRVLTQQCSSNNTHCDFWRTLEESCKGLGSVTLKINTQHTLIRANHAKTRDT